VRKPFALIALASWLIVASASAIDSLSTTVMDLVGEDRIDAKTLKVIPNPDCIADAKVVDKTTCDKAVLFSGKAHIYLTPAIALAALSGGICFTLDSNKAATDDTQQVTPSCTTPATCPERPAYDLGAYQGCLAAGGTKDTCTPKKIGTVANGSLCEGPIVRPTAYRKLVAPVAGKPAMAICGLVAGKQLLVAHDWEKFGKTLAGFPIAQIDPACTAKLQGQAPPPTVTPSGTTMFCMSSDDNAELFIDANSVLVSKFGPQVCSTIALTSGTHPIVVKFVEFSGGALLHVLANGTPLAAGWTCDYFNNTTFAGTPALTLHETVLDVDWKSGSPDPSIGVNGENWSAVCSGTLKIP
jgi:hypothetical protein